MFSYAMYGQHRPCVRDSRDRCGRSLRISSPCSWRWASTPIWIAADALADPFGHLHAAVLVGVRRNTRNFPLGTAARSGVIGTVVTEEARLPVRLPDDVRPPDVATTPESAAPTKRGAEGLGLRPTVTAGVGQAQVLPTSMSFRVIQLRVHDGSCGRVRWIPASSRLLPRLLGAAASRAF